MLQQILEAMYQDAFNRAGVPVSRTLKHGLRIEITANINHIQLTISRNDQFPSVREWETVLKNFPYHVGMIMPTTQQAGSQYSLTANLPARRQAQLSFL